MLSLTPRTHFGLNNFFDDMFSSPFFGNGNTMPMPSMKTDIKEKDGMYVMEMDLPGYEKSDVKAELNNGYLTISVSKDTGEEEQKDEEKATFSVRDIQDRAAEAFMWDRTSKKRISKPRTKTVF